MVAIGLMAASLLLATAEFSPQAAQKVDRNPQVDRNPHIGNLRGQGLTSSKVGEPSGLSRQDEPARSPGHGVPWSLILLFYVALLGVAARSLQCIYLLHYDPFRAVAMGRFIFGIYVLLNLGFTLYSDWPRWEVSAPVSEVMQDTASVGGQKRPVLIVERGMAEVKEPGWVDYLVLLASMGSEAAEKNTLIAFLHLVYARLKGQRPGYDLEHFWHDVTFGRHGKEYKWGR
jgi:hypothetical protein